MRALTGFLGTAGTSSGWSTPIYVVVFY